MCVVWYSHPNVECHHLVRTKHRREIPAWLTLAAVAVAGAVKHGENVDDLAAQSANAIEADRLVFLVSSLPAHGLVRRGRDAAARAHEVERAAVAPALAAAAAAGVGGAAGRLQEEAQVVAAVLAGAGDAAATPRRWRLGLRPSAAASSGDTHKHEKNGTIRTEYRNHQKSFPRQGSKGHYNRVEECPAARENIEHGRVEIRGRRGCFRHIYRNLVALLGETLWSSFRPLAPPLPITQYSNQGGYTPKDTRPPPTETERTDSLVP